MIFHNPKGARSSRASNALPWFDRMTDTCYECGTAVSPEAIAEFDAP